MFLLEFRVLPLERLQLRNLAGGARLRCVRRSAAQSTVLHVLPPLGQHEGMNLERGPNGLYLHPRRLTESYRRQLRLVAVLVDCPWS